MTVQPDYDAIHPWELYCENLQTEYTQCFEEGLDIEPLKPLIDAVSALPRSAEKAALAGTIYQMIAALPLRSGSGRCAEARALRRSPVRPATRCATSCTARGSAASAAACSASRSRGRGSRTSCRFCKRQATTRCANISWKRIFPKAKAASAART